MISRAIASGERSIARADGLAPGSRDLANRAFGILVFPSIVKAGIWVGGEYGSYLITTPQGHILLDTGSTEMHDVIVSNVKKLGFKVEDIKIMISSHAHWDHVQGHAAMKKLTGAQVVALGGDAAALEAGQDNSAGGFPGMIAVHVDRVIKDGDTVSLGGTTLRALWTPGHTQGATVWMTTVQEGGKTYSVAFRGGEIPNDGVPLINNPRHPTR